MKEMIQPPRHGELLVGLRAVLGVAHRRRKRPLQHRRWSNQSLSAMAPYLQTAIFLLRPPAFRIAGAISRGLRPH